MSETTGQRIVREHEDLGYETIWHPLSLADRIDAAIAEARRDTAERSHKPDDLDCDCRECLKNVISQVEAQRDIEAKGYAQTVAERDALRNAL